VPGSALRGALVVVHRYVGLALALFLVNVGLTGSVMAFGPELDAWLNPNLFTTAPRATPMMDPVELRRMAEELAPLGRVDSIRLDPRPGSAFVATVTPRTDPATGKPFDLPATEIFLDPYTGQRMGERYWGRVALDRKSFVPLCFRLHYSLAISNETVATWLFGIVAVLWTIDCFVGFAVTLPFRRMESPGEGAGRSRASVWLRRWKPAWMVKLPAGFQRTNFDLHRALGLWTWVMLFVFAWSSVAFMLRDQVYTPVMKLAFDMRSPENESWDRLPTLAPPLATPGLGWDEALARGTELSVGEAAKRGMLVHEEKLLDLDRERGVFIHRTTWSNGSREGTASVVFDARTGTLRITDAPSWLPGTAVGVVITDWLIRLHTGSVFGMPMRVFVCAMGFVLTAITASGVVIWWKKRKWRRRARVLRTSLS
jgi:uncharacterized iron-regulated membrane protein